MTDWIARGPDDFGDFTISSQGEELAKCVVVQNGFRTPEETKMIAEQLIKAVNNHDALVGALEKIIEMNRQHAKDQYGDAEKAESWACITVARGALDPVGGSRNAG